MKDKAYTAIKEVRKYQRAKKALRETAESTGINTDEVADRIDEQIEVQYRRIIAMLGGGFDIVRRKDGS